MVMNEETVRQVLKAAYDVCLDEQRRPSYPTNDELYVRDAMVIALRRLMMVPDFAARVLGKLAEE